MSIAIILGSKSNVSVLLGTKNNTNENLAVACFFLLEQIEHIWNGCERPKRTLQLSNPK